MRYSCTARYTCSNEVLFDFATGFCAAGPNAFVQCESWSPFGFSGGIDSWSSGILFDDVRVDGKAISLFNRWQDGNGAGWAAANSVLWNCAATRIDCYKPPTAQNWSFGSWAQFTGNGYWTESNNHLEPRSLYYAQLAARLGDAYPNHFAQLLIVETDATSSPTAEQAKELTALAKKPAITLSQFIDDAKKRRPIPVNAAGIKVWEYPKGYNRVVRRTSIMIRNGVLKYRGEILTGTRVGVPCPLRAKGNS